MGLFEIFKRKQEVNENKEIVIIKEIRINEIEDLIDSIYNKKIKEIEPLLSDLKIEYTNETKRLEENIRKLKSAEIKNKNIPERAIQMTLGNKENYINKIESFISENKIPDNFEDIKLFIINFERSINNLSRSSLKSHSIMQEVFLNETNAILLNIKNVDKYVLNIKRLIEDKKINEIDKIRIKSLHLFKEIEKKDNFDKVIREKENNIKDYQENIKKTKKEILNLENSKEYDNFKETKDKIETIEIKLKEKINSIRYLFSSIEPALKKYCKLDEDNSLIQKYLENSLNALIEDKDFRVINDIEKIKSLVSSGKIELKEDKKKRVLPDLNKLNKNDLAKIISDYSEFQKEFDNLNDSLKNNSIDEELKNKKKELEQIKEIIYQNEKEIEKMRKDFNNNVIEEMKINLEKSINDIINERIKIVL